LRGQRIITPARHPTSWLRRDVAHAQHPARRTLKSLDRYRPIRYRFDPFRVNPVDEK